ncbi:hypothetical protein HK405_014018 [Cladochytrium tenue]|nr:hypothetical protein HK405_014018 [Cladochytrium tenue]
MPTVVSARPAAVAAGWAKSPPSTPPPLLNPAAAVSVSSTPTATTDPAPRVVFVPAAPPPSAATSLRRRGSSASRSRPHSTCSAPAGAAARGRGTPASSREASPAAGSTRSRRTDSSLSRPAAATPASADSSPAPSPVPHNLVPQLSAPAFDYTPAPFLSPIWATIQTDKPLPPISAAEPAAISAMPSHSPPQSSVFFDVNRSPQQYYLPASSLNRPPSSQLRPLVYLFPGANPSSDVFHVPEDDPSVPPVPRIPSFLAASGVSMAASMAGGGVGSPRGAGDVHMSADGRSLGSGARPRQNGSSAPPVRRVASAGVLAPASHDRTRRRKDSPPPPVRYPVPLTYEDLPPSPSIASLGLDGRLSNASSPPSSPPQSVGRRVTMSEYGLDPPATVQVDGVDSAFLSQIPLPKHQEHQSSAVGSKSRVLPRMPRWISKR